MQATKNELKHGVLAKNKAGASVDSASNTASLYVKMVGWWSDHDGFWTGPTGDDLGLSNWMETSARAHVLHIGVP